MSDTGIYTGEDYVPLPPHEENTMSDTVTETSTRVFHRGDYARAARLIQRARAVKGNRYQARSLEEMASVDELALTLASVFAADAPGSFDADRFLVGTQLPQAPENVLLDSPPEDEYVEDEYPEDEF